MIVIAHERFSVNMDVQNTLLYFFCRTLRTMSWKGGCLHKSSPWEEEGCSAQRRTRKTAEMREE